MKSRTWGRGAPKKGECHIGGGGEGEGGWISHGWHAAERVGRERERLAIILARLSNKAINCRRSSRREKRGRKGEGGDGKVSGRDRCKGNIKIHSNTFTQPLALQVWQVSPSLRQLERTLGEFTQVA